jgi:hypothetical protein
MSTVPCDRRDELATRQPPQRCLVHDRNAAACLRSQWRGNPCVIRGAKCRTAQQTGNPHHRVPCNWTSTPLPPHEEDSIRAWRAASLEGYCGRTGTLDGDDSCTDGDHGVLRLEDKDFHSPRRAVSACLRSCRNCASCGFISLSYFYKDCSWYRRCELSALMQDVQHFRSGALPGRTIEKITRQQSEVPQIEELLFHRASLDDVMRRPPPRGFALPPGKGGQLSRAEVAHWQQLTSKGASGAFAWGGSCAVVGNSATLRGQDEGALIDAHDRVIRFNDAPTAGYEQFVGRRTSIRVWAMPADGPYSLPWRGWGDERLLVRCDRNTVVDQCWRGIGLGSTHWTPYGLGVTRSARFSPTAWERASRLFRGEPTAGGLAIFTALTVCRNTTVFGFDAPSRGCAHYWGACDCRRKEARLPHHEQQALGELHRAGRLSWRRVGGAPRLDNEDRVDLDLSKTIEGNRSIGQTRLYVYPDSSGGVRLAGCSLAHAGVRWERSIRHYLSTSRHLLRVHDPAAAELLYYPACLANFFFRKRRAWNATSEFAALEDAVLEDIRRLGHSDKPHLMTALRCPTTDRHYEREAVNLVFPRLWASDRVVRICTEARDRVDRTRAIHVWYCPSVASRAARASLPEQLMGRSLRVSFVGSAMKKRRHDLRLLERQPFRTQVGRLDSRVLKAQQATKLDVYSDSTYVFCPPGDTPESERIYSALARGAIPLVHPTIHLPDVADWAQFSWVYRFNRSGALQLPPLALEQALQRGVRKRAAWFECTDDSPQFVRYIHASLARVARWNPVGSSLRPRPCGRW